MLPDRATPQGPIDNNALNQSQISEIKYQQNEIKDTYEGSIRNGSTSFNLPLNQSLNSGGPQNSIQYQ